MEIWLAPLVVTLALGGFAVAVGGNLPDEQPPRFKVTTRRADDAVAVQADNDKVVFAVKSPFGISQAVIERQANEWPKAVMLRLHLKGLESFRASSSKLTLGGAVSAQEGSLKVHQWKDGKEDAPLDKNSPFWVDLRIIGDDGKPAKKLPLRGGYFEMALPKAFFEGNPKSITLHWIDFYR